MLQMHVHHVSMPVRDVEKSGEFYERIFGLSRLERPPFGIPGIWFKCGDRQVHLVESTTGTYRSNPNVEITDTHFAFRTSDFDGVIARLKKNGFDEHAGENDPKRLLVLRGGLAGFDQLYLLDPDLNIIEVNNAPI
jgi:glyoxylase I family protein